MLDLTGECPVFDHGRACSRRPASGSRVPGRRHPEGRAGKHPGPCVRRQRPENGALRGTRRRIGCLFRCRVGPRFPAFACNRLERGQDVRFCKWSVHGRASASTGHETDERVGIMQVGTMLEIFPFRAKHAHSNSSWGRIAGERRNLPLIRRFCHGHHCMFHPTGISSFRVTRFAGVECLIRRPPDLATI
jgi:hypothetical protein